MSSCCATLGKVTVDSVGAPTKGPALLCDWRAAVAAAVAAARVDG
jgi:hypothetical protein